MRSLKSSHKEAMKKPLLSEDKSDLTSPSSNYTRYRHRYFCYRWHILKILFHSCLCWYCLILHLNCEMKLSVLFLQVSTGIVRTLWMSALNELKVFDLYSEWDAVAGVIPSLDPAWEVPAPHRAAGPTASARNRPQEPRLRGPLQREVSLLQPYSNTG